MMIHYIATGLGEALGCMARLLASKLLPATIFGVPSAILFINIFRCLVMGFLIEILAFHWHPSDNIRYFLVSGFLGGFTSFSAFSAEFGLLFEKNEL